MCWTAFVNADETMSNGGLRPPACWRLWLVDGALVSAGMWYFLATQYGTGDFFGQALAMAVLPLMAVMVLVGGAGSTIFALTRVMIEKRSLNFSQSVVLLAGPAMVVAGLLVGLGVWHSPRHRLAYVCHGQVPADVSHVQVTGYSAFLRAEWLAVFHVGPDSFQEWVTRSKLEKTPDYDFARMLKDSSLQSTQLGQQLSKLGHPLCFRRVFNAGTEHERGWIYAAFDGATATAVVLRAYRD
jgi:hypothetical protein